MDTRDIELFNTLYEEKNITHAAKRLYLSQPALTDRMKRLETEFGCTLFIRQPRGILFTAEGERLHAYFLKTQDNYDKMRGILSGMKSHPGGPLTIACSNVFAKYHMPKLLSQFRRRYPQVEIHMKSGFSKDRYRDFLEGKFHVCIVRGDHKWGEEKQMLWQDSLCLFSKRKINMEYLPSYPYVHYITDPLLQSVLDDWWYAHFSKPPMTTIETDAMDTALKMVQQDLGFTLLSESCGQDSPDLTAVPLLGRDGKPLMRQTWMYYRKNYKMLSSVKAFVDFMQEKY